MKKSIQYTLALSFFGSISVFAQVAEEQVISFEAGTPATAADMNQNIQALIAAINENHTQIEALQEQVGMLTELVNQPTQSLEEQITGSSYHVVNYRVSHGSSSGSRLLGDSTLLERAVRQTLLGEGGTLTLNADQTINFSLAGTEKELSLYLTEVRDSDGAFSRFSAQRTTLVENNNDTITGTWSLTGQVLNLNLVFDEEEEGVAFQVSVDGNNLVMLLNQTEVDDGGMRVESMSLVTGTRTAIAEDQ